MAITKETLKSAIDNLGERDIPMVYQVILEYSKRHDTQSGPRMASILQRMADRGALAHIEHPVAWQRKIRKDRPLPGRE